MATNNPYQSLVDGFSRLLIDRHSSYGGREQATMGAVLGLLRVPLTHVPSAGYETWVRSGEP